MSGDTSNARLWGDADVYVAFDLETADPADIDTDFGAGWELVGILDGDDGMPESRDEDVTKFFGWGVGLVRTARAHFQMSKRFTAIESNDTVFRLAYPGSDTDTIVVPKPEQIKVAFEVRDGDNIVERLITANYAEVTPDGDIEVNESDLSKIKFVVDIYPDTTEDPAVLFNRQVTGIS